MKKISEAAKKILKKMVDEVSKINVAKDYSDQTKNLIKNISDMKDKLKIVEESNNWFKKAMEDIQKIEEAAGNITAFAGQLSRFKHHIIAENNEGRAKMDAAIATHSRKFFQQQMYLVARDRLQSEFLVASEPESSNGTATDKGNGTSSVGGVGGMPGLGGGSSVLMGLNSG